MLLARGLARDPTAVPELIPLVADEGDPLVRARACEALGLIGDASEAVTGALLKALRDGGAPDVRASAARGFALLHDKVATQLLRHAAASATGAAAPRPARRRRARSAASRIRPPRSRTWGRTSTTDRR